MQKSCDNLVTNEKNKLEINQVTRGHMTKSLTNDMNKLEIHKIYRNHVTTQ